MFFSCEMAHEKAIVALGCIVLLTIIIVIFTWSPQNITTGNSSLVQAHIIFRHGEKLMDYDTSYPNDPYKSVDSFFPYKRGELSLEGRRNSYKLGQKLNMRYKDFIGQTFYTNIVEATTTGMARTEMTLLSVLASLFPANSNNEIKAGVLWQPILYNKIKTEDDNLLGVYYHTYSEILDEKFMVLDNKTQEIYDYVKLMSGVTKDSGLVFVQHTLRLQAKKNYKLPEWTNSIWPEPITTLTKDWYRNWFNKYLNKLLGNLVFKIISDTKTVINNSEIIDPTKFHIYSGHDINIGALLNFVENPKDIDEVEYLSCFIFEVHLIDGVYGIKFLFQNGIENEFEYLEVPNRGNFISLEEFQKMANERLII